MLRCAHGEQAIENPVGPVWFADVGGRAGRVRGCVLAVEGPQKDMFKYDLRSYQSRFVEAIHEGLADVEAGQTHDGEEVIADLLDELRHKKPRKARSR
jgi:hypothetical protein